MNVLSGSSAPRLLVAALLSLLCGCVVPSLDDVDAKACDVDAGHPCAEGYLCVAGTCRHPGGECTPGETRPCGPSEGACVPGTQECPDGTWSECKGGIGPDQAATFYRDRDGDGYGDTLTPKNDCVAPAGYVALKDDCDDMNAQRHPELQEVCDGLDNDCNGTVDDGISDAMKMTFFRDADQDSYGNAADSVKACSAPAGYVADSSDCDDTLAAVHPGAVETCNGVDDNCDGTKDEGVETVFYKDADGDTFGNPAMTTTACSVPVGYVSNSSDCDDTKSAVNPGAFDGCDGLDNDCSGMADDPPEIALVTTANTATSSLAWTQAGLGMSAVYVDTVGGAAHVFFKRFDTSLVSQGAPVDLSNPLATQSTLPSIVSVPNTDDVIAVWVESVSGMQRLQAARVGPTGSATVKSTPQPAQVSPPGPKIALNNGVVMVAWIDSATTTARGVTYDVQSFNQLGGPIALNGLGGIVLDLDVERLGTSDFVVGTNAITNGTIFETRFGRFDGAAAPTAPPKVFGAGGPVSEIDLAQDSTSSNGVVAAWVEEDQSTTPSQYRLIRAQTPVNGGNALPIYGPTPDLIASVSGHALAGASAVWAFTQGLVPSIVKVQGTTTNTVTPMTTSSTGPALSGMGTWIPYVVGYEQDRGQSFDLYARVLCAP